ncbi:hypothetical protein SDRG_14527 [Saprolegnia diclina VS20]|uniref:Purple acid phosphatase n=1 Tax=Saprolegnia diclina (strain VS20) TaxID=1156394 RepID=T0PQC7_SAPDV|nr:hypothetical protein SDRG_14527 [Saprolegnia diclina VS20]EQC27689.1 hypothetical protein SDRG_14527 [Saprolegnia diclina VS20]|eukprot:XP_008618884.1 hypothetical protein SDRG_14527 [Saprolegnia diclina VS20]
MFPTLASLLASAVLVTAAVDQVHLGLTNANVDCPNGVSVAFASDVNSPLSVSYETTGASPKSVLTTVDSYNVTSTLYNYTSPFLHTARLCNLQPGTTYTYAIEAGTAGCGFVFDNSFVTPPSSTSGDAPTVLGIVGDIDVPHITETLANLAATKPHGILIAGDYAYANGKHEHWDAWYQAAQPVFSSIPTLGISGNHETIKGGGPTKPNDVKYVSENYLGYIHRANNPVSAAQNAKLRTYYSIDIGHVHAVFVDDYTGTRGDDKSAVGTPFWLNERNLQLQWLETDLAAVDRKKTPWVLVIKHNPYYNSWDSHQCQCGPTRFEIPDADKCWAGKYDATSSGTLLKEPHCANQAKFEDLYVHHGVDMVIAGHVHAYERTAPIVQNKIDSKNGVVYLSTGAGGRDYVCKPLPSSSPWSTKMIAEIYGVNKAIATRDTLNVTWVANANGTVLDAFMLQRINGVRTLVDLSAGLPSPIPDAGAECASD